MENLHLILGGLLAVSVIGHFTQVHKLGRLKEALESGASRISELSEQSERYHKANEKHRRLHAQLIEFLQDLNFAMVRGKDKAQDSAGGKVVIPGGTAAGWLAQVQGAYLWSLLHDGHASTLTREKLADPNVDTLRFLVPFRSGLAWILRQLEAGSCPFSFDIAPGMSHNEYLVRDIRETLRALNIYEEMQMFLREGLQGLAHWMQHQVGTEGNQQAKAMLVGHHRGILWIYIRARDQKVVPLQLREEMGFRTAEEVRDVFGRLIDDLGVRPDEYPSLA